MAVIDNTFALLNRENRWTENQSYDIGKGLEFGAYKIRDYGGLKIAETGDSNAKVVFIDDDVFEIHASNGALFGNAPGGYPNVSGKLNAVGYQSNGENLPFQKTFDSNLVSVGLNTTTTVAHGLGEMPRLVTAELVCQSADQGYATGERLFVGMTSSMIYNGGWLERTFYVSANASNLYVIFGQSPLVIMSKDTHSASAELDTSKWKIQLRAYV